MRNTPLFWEMFFVIIIVGVLDRIANFYHLYWLTNEFDSMVHFFGGAVLGLFFLWLYFFSRYFNPKNRSLSQFILVATVGSMFIAVTWEIYELLLGEAEIQKSEYPYDTTLDFIMDLLGMLAATFYGYIKELESGEVKSL